MKRRSLLAFAAFAAPFAATPVVAQDSGRALVEAFYARLLNGAGAADLAERAAAILAEDWRSVGDYSGRDKTRAEFVGQLGGFARLIPDLKWQIAEMLPTGDRWVVRGRATGTPTAPFFGVPPSGKSFDIMSIDIHTLAGGRIVRSYHVEDWAAALRQLRTA
jgi:predicted ester cyclase